MNSILLQTAKQGQQVIKISGPGFYYTFQRKEIHIISYSYVATADFSSTLVVLRARTNGENRTDVQHWSSMIVWMTIYKIAWASVKHFNVTASNMKK